MSGPSLSLAEQLKALSAPTQTLDPESAYSSIDSLKPRGKTDAQDENEGREHYLEVGPSRLRSNLSKTNELSFNQDESAGGTLRGDKYAGVTRGRVRIFDDDEEESEGDEEDEGAQPFGQVEEDDEEDDEDEEDEDENEEDEDELDDEEDEEEGEDDEEDEGEDAEEEEDPAPAKITKASTSGRALDPVASLRDSRLKDIEKGRGIRRQKALFESLLTLRITFQKALSSSTSIPSSLPSDPAGELAAKRVDMLKSLGELNERLFTLREGLQLPDSENVSKGLGKRKRDTSAEDEEYWVGSAKESLALSDAAQPQLLPILTKWSSKIQAASMQLGSKQAGGSKFLQTVKNGAGGIVDAIEAGLTSKRDSEKTLMESEEQSYRALLREVIESRSGSGPAADLTHLRKEKKKKREAERGGSKGRKLRYTTHEKAQNFIVPIPLHGGWHEEQVDELFSSLFGGVGMHAGGAVAETRVEVDAGLRNGDDGEGEGDGLSLGGYGLGGLKVF